MGYVCVYPSRAMPLWTSFSADFFARRQDEMSAETPGFSQGFSSHHADVSLVMSFLARETKSFRREDEFYDSFRKFSHL